MLTKGLCMLRPCFTGVSAWNPPQSPCPVICQTIASIDDIPAEPVDGCEFLLLFNGETGVVGIFNWDGIEWVLLAGGQTTFADGTITEFAYQTINDWTISLNGEIVSGDDAYVFDPAPETLDIILINGACSYAMEPIVAPPVLLQLVITYDDPSSVPGTTDPETWYASLFDGIVFDSIDITGAVVTFFGYTPGVFKQNSFIQQSNILSIVDGGLVASILGANPYTILTTCVFPAITAVPDNAFKDSTALAAFTADLVETIGTRAFEGVGAMEASFPNCTSLGEYAFYASGVVSASFPILTVINGFAFNFCTSLLTYSFPEVISIGTGANGNSFNGSGILTIDFPKAVTIEIGSFANCASAATLSLPLAETLADNALDNCDALVTATFPEVHTAGSFSVANCNNLTDLSLPKLTSVATVGDTELFSGNGALQNFSAPILPFLPAGSLRICPSLVTIDLTSCVNLGETVGDDLIFEDNIGTTTTLTVPLVLQTCNAGNPDGDITYFASISTVNVIYV